MGEAWLGPKGLLAALETPLGLQAPAATVAERTASVLASVAAESGFHSRSAGSDLFGTARRLLRDRDLLWMYGWRGQGPTPRLAQLAAATADALPGPADRLAEVVSWLGKQNGAATPIEHITLLDPIEAMAPLWRELFEVLARLGSALEPAALPAAPASGDLRAARSAGFEPAGDGSLELVRGHGALQTSDDAVAWLAAHAPLEDTLIVGADEVLDAALHRHGLPPTGSSKATGQAAACLQIVPLVLELLFDPPNPRRALELLCLPESPVPTALGRRLRRALRVWPAVASPAWNEAVQEHLAGLGDDRRVELERRLSVLLTPYSRHGEPLPVEEIRARLETLSRWLARRAAASEGTSSLALAHQQCRLLIRLLGAWPDAYVREPQLRRLVESATESIRVPPSLAARAGLDAVGRPGCMAGPAQIVVWWSFSRDQVSVPLGVRLPGADREALQRLGIPVPNPGTEAASLAERWRRPLLLAQKKLILCCPRRSPDGEERFPHPLWDEIEAAMPMGELWRLRRRLIVERPGLDLAIPTEPRPLIALPSARRRWAMPSGAAYLSVAEETVSGMIELVRCPFAWTCRRAAALDEGAATYWIRTDARIIGSLAHHLLRQVLETDPQDAGSAEALVEQLFEESGPRLAADLFIPGAATEQADTRVLLGRAARALVERLRRADLIVEGLEVPRSAELAGRLIKGRLDLVLGPEPAVVDLKLGGREPRTEELRNGTACQLAVYGRLLQSPGGAFPRVGYFILGTGQLISPQPAAVKGSQGIPGADPGDTWTALETAYARRLATIEGGEVHATGVSEPADDAPPTKDSLTGGELTLTPPCDYCRYGGLCGRTLDVMP